MKRLIVPKRFFAMTSPSSLEECELLCRLTRHKFCITDITVL